MSYCVHGRRDFNVTNSNFLFCHATTPFCLGSDWIYHQGFCYHFSDGYKIWLDARADCLSRGGDLASVLSEEENSFILSQLKIMKKRGPVWIGYRKFQNNSYAWSDGNRPGFKILNFSRYSSSSIRQCVGMRVEVGVWFNYYCFNEEQYVCKRLNDSSTTTVQTTLPSIMKVCPTGFVGSDKVNKCYAVVGLGNQTKYSWYDAVTFCTKMSSEFKVLLASINSAQEQDLVSSLTSKLTEDVWIGLISHQRLGTTFKWLDGSNVAYTRWSSGYPQRIPFYPGNTWTRNTWTGKLPMSKIFREHSFRKHAFRHPILSTCVEIISGQSSASWRNTECSDRNAYLCQTPALSRIRSVTESVGSPSSPATRANGDVSTFIAKDRALTFTVPISNQSEKPVTVSNQSDKPITVSNQSDKPVHVSNQSDNPVTVSNQSDKPVPVSNQSDKPVPVSNQSDKPVPVSNQSDKPVPVSNKSDKPSPSTASVDVSSLISVTVDLFTGLDSDQISSTNASFTSMADQSTTTFIENVNVFSLIPKDSVSFTSMADHFSDQSTTTSVGSVEKSSFMPNDSVSFTSMADHFSDQSTTTSVGSVEVSSFMPNDSVSFTSMADLFSDQSVTDHAINQSSTTQSGIVNVTFISSKSSVSDTSLTKTDTALIVIGILVLVGGTSAAVVVILVRRKRRRAQIPIQQLSYQGGFHNVLYSAIHDVEI